MPRTVVALGFVSLFMDISSEIIHSLLPVFLVTVLGAGTLSVGLIEGIAEATSQVAKLFSGAVSDWIGRRKLLVLLGYGIAALTKPPFPLASGIGTVLIARFVDRIGKGIRGAPRDALIGDVTPVELRGTAFGLRQSMDTVGAFLGPLLAILYGNQQQQLPTGVLGAVIPAIISVLLILYAVKEPDAPPKTEKRPFPIQQSELRRLDIAYWWLVGIATVLTLGRFSEAFLLLAAKHVGLPVTLIPSVLVAMNIVYAACVSVWQAIGRC
jgi:MFS family permease